MCSTGWRSSVLTSSWCRRDVDPLADAGSNRGRRMNRVAGKVALITGAARGQGRSHAIQLAREGADIIAVDYCTSFDTISYPMASAEDLAQTAKEVEALDRRVLTVQADTR